MPEEVTEVKKKKQNRVFNYVCPFGVKKPKIAPYVVKNDDHIIVDRMHVDKETLIVSPVFSKTSWQEEIDSNVGNCGMELMKKQLRQGAASPEDFYDDGKSGVNTTLIPETVHEARKKSDALNKSLADLALELGLTEEDAITAKALEEKLTAAVKSKYEAEQAAAQAKTEGESK